MTDTIFDHDADSRLNQYDIYINNLLNILARFDLTRNQSKVYIFLGKYGMQTANVISKTLKIPRTETYDVLQRLQKKGLVNTIVGHPSRYTALSFREAIKTLLDSERQRINNLQRDVEESEKLWDQIPDFAISSMTKDARLQTLQGKHVIVSKINEMCTKANELLVLGTEKDFIMFYHSGILDLLTRSNLKFRILSSCSDKTMNIFSGLDSEKIKIIPEKSIETFGFIVKDGDEAIFFIKNEEKETQDLLALGTDSISIINTLKMSFDLLWSSRKNISTNNKALVKRTQEYEFKLKEIEQENLILRELNDYIQKASGKTKVKSTKPKPLSGKNKA